MYTGSPMSCRLITSVSYASQNNINSGSTTSHVTHTHNRTATYYGFIIALLMVLSSQETINFDLASYTLKIQ